MRVEAVQDVVLLFIFLYKLGDSMATALATPFYLDMGFSRTDIGVIAKNAASRYLEGKRGPNWLKMKVLNRQEAVIGGFTEPQRSRLGLGALSTPMGDAEITEFVRALDRATALLGH